MGLRVRFRAKTQRSAETQRFAEGKDLTRFLRSLRALRYFAPLREPIIRNSIISISCLALFIPSTLIAQTARNTPNQTSPKLNGASPESVGMSSSRLAKIDEAVLASISRKETPGAVVLVARKGRIVYRKAFGDRAIEPKREPMTIDTIFDLASLTKIVATATSIMIFVERGKVSLADPVALYIPEFGKFGKERVTFEQLMTHRAGLPPDNEIADYVGKSVDPMQQIYDLRPSYEPGTRFVYSDVGFIVAAEIVRRVSSEPVNVFAHKNIFRPLRMTDTFYVAPTSAEGMLDSGFGDKLSWRRTAPTESREGRWMRGEVHDPRAYEMGGVAGHAGLFSTADDLAIFCQMILNKGEYNGVRILAPYSV